MSEFLYYALIGIGAVLLVVLPFYVLDKMFKVDIEDLGINIMILIWALAGVIPVLLGLALLGKAVVLAWEAIA